MNAFLLSLGIALLMLLTGALAAPFFIDWSSQRHFFETHAAEVLGRPVEFAGPMEVRLVPFPRLMASDVRIGDPGGRQEGVERISITAALTPLLGGQVEISEIVLTRPTITLAMDAEGELSWAAERGDRTLSLPADRTRLERLEIIEGTVVLDGAFGGGRHEITGVNATGSAGSLAGPFRLEGGGLVDGQRYSLRLGTGRLRDDGAMRFTASIVPAGRAFTVELDGALQTNASQGIAYRGKAVVARPLDDEQATPWRLDGNITATAREISVEGLALSIGPETERLALSGTAMVDLTGTPTFDMALATRQLDFDRVYGGGAEDPVSPAIGLARINELLEATAHLAPGHLSLEVGSVVLAGNLVEKLTAELELGASGWRIVEAQARAPGLTDARFSGLIERIDGSSTVTGNIRLETRQASALTGWLFGPDARIPGLGAVSGHIRAESELGFGPDFLRFSELQIEAADTRLAGEIVYSRGPDGGRPELVARIETDHLWLDQAQRATDPLAISELLAILGQTDVDLAIEADVVQAGSVEARDVTVVVARSGEDLRVDRLRIGDLGGARIDGYGQFTDIATAPGGSLSLEVEAASLESAAAMLAEFGLTESAQMISTRAEALAPLALAVSIEATQIQADLSRAEVELSGIAGGTEIDSTIGFQGRVDRLLESDVRVALEAENHDGFRLLEQVGLSLSAGSPGMGRLQFSARGRPGTAMEFSLDTVGPGLEGRSQGDLRFAPRGGREISGEFEVAFDEPGVLLDAAGVKLPPGGNDNPLTARGRLSADGAVWRFSDIAATTGDGSARGTISLDLGDAAPVADGTLELAHLDLPWLLAVLLGPDALASPEVEGENVWPEEGFSPLDPSGLRARLRLSTPRLDLGDGIHARRAGLDLRVSPGRFGLENIRGSIWSGQISGELELALLQGAVQLEGRLGIERARLEELSWRNGERALAAGLLSASVEASASGRSMLGLVSTLSGGGSIRIEEGVIRHMNPRAFGRIVEAADDGLPLEEEEVNAAFQGHLDAGSLRFERAEGSFSLATGVAQTRNVRLDGAPINSFVSASLDLSRLQLESLWAMRDDSPGLEGRVKEVDVLFTGPIEAPQRQIDVAPLLGYLTIRAYEQEVERLEEMQSEIRSRQLRRQDVSRFNREQERYEREREDRASRLEEDAQEREEIAEDEETPGPAALETQPSPIIEEPAQPDAGLSRGAFEQLIRDALGDRPDGAQRQSAPPREEPTAPSRPLNIVPPFAGIGGAAPPQQ